MRVTEVLILAVQFAVVSGTLTVLTGKEDADRSDHKSRELVCVSDDDGAGLTWNCDLNCNQSSVIAFQNPNELGSRSLLDCELNQNGSCTSSWSTDGWSLTSSMVTPMGPVLDRRWEGFTETQEVPYVDLFSLQSFVVSIRGSGYINLKICEMTDGDAQFCYLIRLRSLEETTSSLSICPVRGTRPHVELFFQDCVNHKYFQPTVVFPLEWNTFVVTWNECTRNISVYDSEKMILNLVDSEKRLAKPNTRHVLQLGDNKYNPKARFRLHEYDFLHTTNEDAVLASPKLSVNTTNFCVEMAVGLCAECNLKLTLENPSTKKAVHTLEEIEGFPTVHGFPAWRYVRVNKSISLRNSTVQLKMLTILRNETSNPLWAVANVRACPPADSIRKGRMKATEDVICQKLFNKESTVVNSSSPATLNTKFADSDCQLGKVGPHCSISCTEDLQLGEDCKNAKICEESGCSCSPGYTGSRCDKRCPPSQYGNDCNKTCDFCLHDDCDFRTGECKSGCKQSKGCEVQPISKNNGEPENFRLEVHPQGLVNVSWRVANSSPIRKFILSIRTMCSNLRTKATRSSISIREYPVENSVKEYKDQLYLMPSTTYDISIRTETVEGCRSEKEFDRLHTSLAIAFEKELSLEVRNDSLIVLYIPVVLNDTQRSEMHVLVKGSQPCDQSVKAIPDLADKAKIDNNDNDTVWHVATFPTNKFAGKRFVVGDNESYGGAVNCSLKPLETYVITVLVTEEVSPNVTVLLAKSSVHVGEGPKQSTWLKNNIVHFYRFTILVLILAAAAVYLYQRKKMTGPAHKNFRENIPLISVRNSTSDHEPPVYTLQKKLKEFEGYVKEAIEERLLYKQYNTLSGVKNKPSDYGMLSENCPKNRFPDLVAYDDKRVILNKLPDKPHSDYINANYIQGFREMRYIATQGPTSATVEDFWRMIWQEESRIICMMADVIGTGNTECYQYWPNVGEHMEYGNIVVENEEQTVYADYTFRIFYLTCGEQRRKIEQLHYTAWPYHGVPLSSHSVVKYLKKLKTTTPEKGPIVVHGVAGGGRTGTIILCDICLRRAEIEGMIDVFDAAMSIRSQRANMIDNKQQYLFAHFTLVEYLFLTEKPLPCDDRLTEQINERKKRLRDQLASFITANIGRVCLKRYPPTDENSDYISAVYVDGVKMRNQYIATQSPMPETLRDFWRMVAENKIELIVALQSPDPNDKTCCSIVPSLEFKPPDISIKTKESTTHDYYKLEKLTLLNNMVYPSTELQVTIITSTEWKPGKNHARPSPIKLITLWQATEKINRGDGPSLVVCYDGITGCGLYLALNIMLEIMTMEDECDVCWASRVVKGCNEHFVKSEEEMMYLYDAAITYNKIYKSTDHNPIHKSIHKSNATDQLYTVT